MKRPFDDNVKVGELRIFADTERPVVALISEDRGAFGFRIIPVSDFTNVSCEGEQLVGDRVYQHWNACNVPRSFASRSWLVATLPPSEFNVIRSSTSTSNFDCSPYRRAYLFSVPGVLSRPEEESSRRNSSFFIFHSSFRAAVGFAIAACAVIALVFAVRLDLDRATHREEQAHAWNLVLKPGEPEALQAVADEAAESESVVVAGNTPKLVIAPPDDAQIAREPEIRGKVDAPKMAKVESADMKPETALDKVDVAVMRRLSRKTTDEHAIAVLTYLACGVNANDREFGAKLTESTEKLVERMRNDSPAEEYTRRLVATALCRAYAATSNPDLKASAESALDSLGDKRAVEIVARGYGPIEDWFASHQEQTSGPRDSVAASVVYPDWFSFLRSRQK